LPEANNYIHKRCDMKPFLIPLIYLLIFNLNPNNCFSNHTDIEILNQLDDQIICAGEQLPLCVNAQSPHLPLKYKWQKICQPSANPNWSTYTIQNGLGGNIIRSIYRSNDIIYAATNSGVSISNNNGITWLNYNTANSNLINNSIRDIFIENGFIYVATSMGISISPDNGVSWSNFNNANSGISNNVINSIYVENGVIYVGTFFNGVTGGVSISFTNGMSWVNFSTADGLGSTIVNDILVSGNYIYTATVGGGVSISGDSGNTWQSFTTTDGLLDNTVRSIYIEGNVIYAATIKGISISSDNGLSWTASLVHNEIIHPSTFDVIYKDKVLYVATFGGLSISTDNGISWLNYTDANSSLSSNFVRSILVQDDHLYVGTDGGGITVLNFSFTEDLSFNSCFQFTSTVSEDNCKYQVCITDDSGVTITSNQISIDVIECTQLIPTLNQWGQICLGILILIVGISSIKNMSPRFLRRI